MEELLDAFHLLNRIGRACVSDAHAAYPKFMESLSDAMYLVDTEDKDDNMPNEMRYIRDSERLVRDDFYLTMANLVGHGLSFGGHQLLLNVLKME